MFTLNKLTVIDEYVALREEKEKLETELYEFKLSIKGDKPTYEELEKELRYMDEISIREYKMQQLRDELKIIAGVRAGLSIIGITALLVSLVAAKGCTKKNTEPSEVPTSEIEIVTNDEYEDAISRTLTINK